MSNINIQLPTHDETGWLGGIIKKQFNAFLKENVNIAEADRKLSHGPDAISDKVCGIYLKTKSKNMFATQKGVSFEASFAKAVGKLQAYLSGI